jgi:hypothetical protein
MHNLFHRRQAQDGIAITEVKFFAPSQGQTAALINQMVSQVQGQKRRQKRRQNPANKAPGPS